MGEVMSEKIQDLVMIGAGPSALAAAIYTSREDIDTVLYEKAVVGGIPAVVDMIDNYPGFPDGIEGMTLAEQMEKQAKRFGSKIEFGEVSGIRSEGDYKILTIDGNDVKAKAVLIATGSSNSKVGVPGEEEYYGRGVHYCATCDGAFYRGKKLAVIGGGNSAVQESFYLTKFASHIDLIVRSVIRASDVLQAELQKYVEEGKITVHLGAPTEEIVATDGHVSAVRIKKDGKSVDIAVDGVFVFVGLKPNTGFLQGSNIELDGEGFIKTNEKLETNMPGVFASGDVRSGAIMQIAVAVGEGVTAAIKIDEYLRDFGK
jgi:thioredoxin reductase (NADPH)